MPRPLNAPESFVNCQNAASLRAAAVIAKHAAQGEAFSEEDTRLLREFAAETLKTRGSKEKLDVVTGATADAIREVVARRRAAAAEKDARTEEQRAELDSTHSSRVRDRLSAQMDAKAQTPSGVTFLATARPQPKQPNVKRLSKAKKRQRTEKRSADRALSANMRRAKPEERAAVAKRILDFRDEKVHTASRLTEVFVVTMVAQRAHVIMVGSQTHLEFSTWRARSSYCRQPCPLQQSTSHGRVFRAALH